MNAIPKVFVIGLSQMPDRWRTTESHLKSLGIEPTVFLGLYGKDLGLESTRDVKQNVYFELTPNRIALALNHWFLWNHVALLDIPAIIFEDDVMLPDNFFDFFAENMANTPTDWEFVYLSLLYPERLNDGRIGGEKVAEGVWRHTGPKTWDGACDGTHAYMVSSQGAKKMARLPFNLDSPIDRWMSFSLLPYLRTYMWHPSFIKQHEWTSTTQYGAMP